MNKKLSIFTVICFLSAITLFSCKENDKSTDAPNVSKVNVAYASYPFYKDIAALDSKNIGAGLYRLKAKYPGFLDFYLDTLVGAGFYHEYNDTNQFMITFLTHKDYRNLLDTVNKAFPDTKKFDQSLKQVFQYIRYYDTSMAVPQHVYYFVSGLNRFTAVTHNDIDLCIGLDMFLGRDFVPYRAIGIPDFATVRFTADNIPVWAARAIYQNKYPFRQEDKTLLELMVEKGKELYFLEKVVPFTADSLRFGFTGAQMKWCAEHEAMIYNFFIQNNLLFENNLQKIVRFVDDGPTTAGMPPESPGNTGSYIGWKIVRQYAAQHKLSLQQVLEIKDAQKILQGANYKP
jgi:hypothetical protein